MFDSSENGVLVLEPGFCIILVAAFWEMCMKKKIKIPFAYPRGFFRSVVET